MLGGKNKQPLECTHPSTFRSRLRNRPEACFGYTIIEVMVVLAISGVMFLIAAQFINGKEAKTAFTSGVNEMASQIQDVIEQVNDGRYSDIHLNCSGGVATIGIGQQGTNTGCVFMGKVIHFETGNRYELISVAANRQNPVTNELITSPLDPGANATYISGLTTQAAIPQQLWLNHPILFDNVPNGYGLGILPAKNLVGVGITSSNTQTVGLYYVQNMQPFDNETKVVAVNWRPLSGPAKNASICLTDGTRYAEIKLGDFATKQNGQLSASVQMDDTAC